MSIYGTTLILAADEHPEDCAIWVETSDCVYERTGNCSCGIPTAPYVYQGSHVLPAESDRRGGSIDLGTIPGFITRDGRDDGTGGPYDWLRVALFGEGEHQNTILLNRAAVTELRDALNDWLERENEAP